MSSLRRGRPPAGRRSARAGSPRRRRGVERVGPPGLPASGGSASWRAITCDVGDRGLRPDPLAVPRSAIVERLLDGVLGVVAAARAPPGEGEQRAPLLARRAARARGRSCRAPRRLARVDRRRAGSRRPTRSRRTARRRRRRACGAAGRRALSSVRVRPGARKPHTSRSSSCLVNTRVGSPARWQSSAYSIAESSTAVSPTRTSRADGVDPQRADLDHRRSRGGRGCGAAAPARGRAAPGS